MLRKSKFIVNRHTWRLDQFEFSVTLHYQECLTRLKALEAALQDDYDKHANGRGFRPILKLESDNDASSFELLLENANIAGTIQQITDETTLFVGLAQLSPTFYMIVAVLVIVGLIVGIMAFLSAYVSTDPSSVWSIKTVQSALSAGLIPIAGTLLFYLSYRWYVWRAVKQLVDTFGD